MSHTEGTPGGVEVHWGEDVGGQTAPGIVMGPIPLMSQEEYMQRVMAHVGGGGQIGTGGGGGVGSSLGTEMIKEVPKKEEEEEKESPVIVSGVYGKAVREPLLIISKDLFTWIRDRRHKSYGCVYLLGKQKGKKNTSVGIRLQAAGGCSDSQLITNDQIVNNIQLFKEIKTSITALCTFREYVPGDTSNVFMRNVINFCEKYEDFAYVVFTKELQIVWSTCNKEVQRSILGIGR